MSNIFYAICLEEEVDVREGMNSLKYTKAGQGLYNILEELNSLNFVFPY